MFRNSFLALILFVAMVTMACGLNFNMPVTRVTTGETITEELSIPVPADTTQTTDLTISFGAGEIDLASGAGSELLTGTATYNVADFKPEIRVTRNRVRLEQGDLTIDGIPNFDDNIINEWHLALGSETMRLAINAGAYKGSYELGGLSLQELEISDGAADVNLSFDEPNTIEMDTFSYSTGASNVRMEGLANANFERMIFRCGAGSYVLDFSGNLQRDAIIEIETGISNIEIIVPEGVSAVLEFSGGLSNVDTHGDWVRQSGDYVLEGEGPTLTFRVEMGAGNLDLRNR